MVDAVDTVTAKLALVMAAKEKGVPIISSMGAGNKLEARQKALLPPGHPPGILPPSAI